MPGVGKLSCRDIEPNAVVLDQIPGIGICARHDVGPDAGCRLMPTA